MLSNLEPIHEAEQESENSQENVPESLQISKE
jgi:hypothetical protein